MIRGLLSARIEAFEQETERRIKGEEKVQLDYNRIKISNFQRISIFVLM